MLSFYEIYFVLKFFLNGPIIKNRVSKLLSENLLAELKYPFTQINNASVAAMILNLIQNGIRNHKFQINKREIPKT